jgi:4-hydroxymandelate oxidase
MTDLVSESSNGGDLPPAAVGAIGSPIDLSRLEAEAGARLDPAIAGYIGSGAGDSVDANVSAWGRLRLQPFMLRDVTQVSTTTSILKRSAPSPILVAPTAMHRLVCSEGERATARAAAAAGTIYVISMAATRSIEDIASAATDGVHWMQAYVRRDRGVTRAALERAAAAGCQAIVVTVDSPGHPDYRPRPGRPLNGELPLPNLAASDPHPDVLEVAADYATDLTFDELTQIRGWTGLPLVVKGILRGSDAARCVDAGADAVAVSNHGGRQVPGCLPTAVALPEVVQAVAGNADVYVDGGIRSGADVLKALSLGATAVMVGRPIVWGLAINGEIGARGVLDELHRQLTRTMALCGIVDAGAVPRDLVREV